MKKLVTWLVVGGDGLIGRRLASDASSFADSIITSSRRPDPQPHPHSTRVFADLASGEISAAVDVRSDVAFLCAAMTNMQKCRDNPELSWKINVAGTAELASELVRQGCFVVFLSSNTVFDGNEPWPIEGTPHSPNTEYGRQKAAVEKQLLAIPGADRQIAIVRLSKVLSAYSGVAAEFTARLLNGVRCRPFSDLFISPVSLRYVSDGLIGIAVRRCGGIYHLSGDKEISYVDFALRLAERLGIDPSLIDPVTASHAGVDVLFQPRHPGLGMQRTGKMLEIAPETLENVLTTLVPMEQ